ncbi:cell adhesion molecule 3-like [Helicoverpa zea]|uniref:cell adhesion molecule 3-like n=1 Tax=Helicoverpa zea TaxID=7113 RepID=UPI001F596C16|nr:cell adhesion molecule 3-like [Helicoverpa zea]
MKMGTLWLGFCLFIFWITDAIALRDVQLIAPSAVKLGDTVLLGCKWTLEGNETLYSVKWYRGRQEFFSYLPKEYPFTRIFAQPGIEVDVSRSTSQQVVLREATRALAGRYRCEVSADAPSFHTQVRSAYIHVVELPPEKPTIKAEKGWYASGDSLRAQCSSPPADPPANLTWLLNGRDIQGKPIIQQRILPSPVVSIDAPHTFRSTPTPIDEHNNIIFSPWKAFGPFVDTIQEGELLPSQDTVVLPSPRHHDSSMDEDATDPMPTPETSNKVASISQLSFMVRPDSFERGQLRLTCISTVHSVYSEQAELVINEERPQIASVLGTRDAAGPVAESLLLMLVSSIFAMHDVILRNILR